MIRSESDINVALGRVLREHRRARDLSQEDLGQACGISYQQVQKYESGTNRISVARLLLLASALSVDPSDLIRRLKDDVQIEASYPSTGQIERLALSNSGVGRQIVQELEQVRDADMLIAVLNFLTSINRFASREMEPKSES